jgi:hypothetical protein
MRQALSDDIVLLGCAVLIFDGAYQADNIIKATFRSRELAEEEYSLFINKVKLLSFVVGRLEGKSTGELQCRRMGMQ